MTKILSGSGLLDHINNSNVYNAGISKSLESTVKHFQKSTSARDVDIFMGRDLYDVMFGNEAEKAAAEIRMRIERFQGFRDFISEFICVYGEDHWNIRKELIRMFKDRSFYNGLTFGAMSYKVLNLEYDDYSSTDIWLRFNRDNGKYYFIKEMDYGYIPDREMVLEDIDYKDVLGKIKLIRDRYEKIY